MRWAQQGMRLQVDIPRDALPMPTRPLGPCLEPGCAARAAQQGRCAQHARAKRWEREDQSPRVSRSSTALGYDRQWRKRRAAYLLVHPFCIWCGALGLTMMATQVDHVWAKRRGGSDDEGNLQGLCAACHARKTARADGGFGNRSKLTGPKGSAYP